MISVLLRTRNEQEHIGFCLQSINDVLGRDTEVLIANNNSTDDTMSIIQMFDWMDIEIFDVNSYTPGKTLNYLVSKSTNNILLTLSAHCKLLPNENIGPTTDMNALAAHGTLLRGEMVVPIFTECFQATTSSCGAIFCKRAMPNACVHAGKLLCAR